MHGARKHDVRGERKGRKEQQRNNILHELVKGMGHRYNENGKEEEGDRGRNQKKRLVMSVLSATSFVDSHQVSITTVESLWGIEIRH